jgi:soluble lytic murein transglycosylase-like protein
MHLSKSIRRIYLRSRQIFCRRAVIAWVICLAVPIIAGAIITWTWINHPEWINRPELTLEESPPDYRILVCRYSHLVNLPEVFVHKVVLAESSGRPWVVSKVGAKGLMQILPAAETDALKRLKRTKKGNLFNPEYNLLIGTTYLRMLTDRFDGDPYLVLAGYHMGPTRVAKHRLNNPSISGKELVARFAGPQTRAYCHKILQGSSFQLLVTQRDGKKDKTQQEHTTKNIKATTKRDHQRKN